MFYGILILAIILLIAVWIREKCKSIALLDLVKIYENKLDEERRWSKKMLQERNDAIKKNIELEKIKCESISKRYEAPFAEVIKD